MSKNYVAYHVHSTYSLLDSCTNYKDYIDKAVELGQGAIAFSEHGKPLNWVSKYLYCKEKGIKYIHAVEIYLTESLTEKKRDNFHTVLIAKNMDGVREINRVVSKSCDEDHFYYTNRLSFDEFLALSDNVITTSACLASPLNKLDVSHERYEELVRRYDYLEIQPHNHPEQIAYNIHLAELSAKYNTPLIAGTDAHSLNSYKAECRKILLKRKHKSYGDEDAFDLTYKSYDELCKAFKAQDAIPENLWLQAIENTNSMADLVEEFEFDSETKYPILYGSREEDSEEFEKKVYRKFNEKLDAGIIPELQKQAFENAIKEELGVFKKIGMDGFMLTQSELNGWCKDNGIPLGPARGSVGGSRVAYVTDIIDLNPETWNTVFSRFCNVNRVEAGDIDTDCREQDRPKIFEYIIGRFGRDKTARVASYGTIQEAGAIDDICGALRLYWNEENGYTDKDSVPDCPYSLKETDKIKAEYKKDPEATRRKFEKVFYYFDGLVGTEVSQSVHPAGMVISPIRLDENYGVFDKEGISCLCLDMEDAHSAGLVKYDFLVLNTINIIADACKSAGIPFPRSHEIDWNDQKVWDDMLKTGLSIFQFEGDFAAQMLKAFKPKSIFDMSLVTACIRPSGASYRDDLIKRKIHKNPSHEIDILLQANYGYLVYQEDTILFLQKMCGMNGSDADSVRRAIGHKDMDEVQKWLPSILEGYCAQSPQSRDIAEKEAKEFLQVIEDSASYQFNYSHSVAYCMLGYICAYLRCYYPHEFITAYLNNPNCPEDIINGTTLANEYKIQVTSPRWGVSREHFVFDKERNIIAKGLDSLKYFNKKVGCELYDLANSRNFDSFVDVLLALKSTSIDSRQSEILLKIGFFKEFGNDNELARIYEVFNKFKQGDAKTIKADKLAEMSPTAQQIVKMFATNINAKGEELKTYTITDCVSMLKTFEAEIIKLGLPDIDLKTRIQNSLDCLGYVDITTGRTEDRRKLIIEELTEQYSKENGAMWAVRINTMSIGTGKKARLTIKTRTRSYINSPVKKGDVIYVDDIFQNNKGFWEITQYHHVYS